MSRLLLSEPVNAFDEGFDLFKREPDLIMTEVWHRIPDQYNDTDRYLFVSGYRAARAKHDDYKRYP